jgi:nicotinamidase-related amidase
LLLVGLATDFCVAFSALDAVENGFDVKIRMDACRGIDNAGSMDSCDCGTSQSRVFNSFNYWGGLS